jgi:PPK2 family polyphosphate:nucleotide phosphotransferase
MAKSFAARFRVEPGKRAHLNRRDPADVKAFPDRKSAEEQSVKDGAAIDKLQDRLYAEQKRAVLVVLQGIDTAGKDGTIRHVFKGVNPQGVRVTGFKEPSEEEKRHDFLWRVHKAAPAAGEIGIFNRSHYEDVLIVRVHNLVAPAVWNRRYGQINDFEAELTAKGITVVKCFLHISREEQQARLQARLEDPTKHWKYNPADVDEREFWPAYAEAYQAALERCNNPDAPWYVIPSDRKWYRNWAVTTLLLETLKDLDPQWPKADFDVEKEKARLAAT